jgi:hypothetical protein
MNPQQIQDQIQVNITELEVILSHALNLVRVTKELQAQLEANKSI